MEQADQKNRFDVQDKENWLKYLMEHGYVVVGNVISQDDCAKHLRGMKESIAAFSEKLDVDNDETWADNKNYPYLLCSGMIQYIGQAKFQWELREKTTPIFSHIWNCKEDELATSFDGFCYMDGRRKLEPPHFMGNVHTDQSPLIKGLWSIQGLVNLIDNGDKDGGFVVVPDTQKIHEEFFVEIGKENHPYNYYEFSNRQKQDPIFEKGMKVNAKAGDMILWDSRTFHGNTIPSSENTRAAAYICQIPKANVSELKRKDRKAAFQNMRCSTHHPGSGFESFPEYPRINVLKSNPRIKEAIAKVSLKWDDLNDLQKSLCCI